MNVHWTTSALQQLRTIHEHIAQNSPDYAQRMVDRLTRRSEQIALFPMSGRTVPEYEAPQVRELIEGPYRKCMNGNKLAYPHRAVGSA